MAPHSLASRNRRQPQIVPDSVGVARSGRAVRLAGRPGRVARVGHESLEVGDVDLDSLEKRRHVGLILGRELDGKHRRLEGLFGRQERLGGRHDSRPWVG